MATTIEYSLTRNHAILMGFRVEGVLRDLQVRWWPNPAYRDQRSRTERQCIFHFARPNKIQEHRLVIERCKKKTVAKWKNKNNGKSICVPSWETHIADSSPLHVEGLSKSLFFTDQRVPLLRAFNWFGWPTQLPRPFPRTLLREESVGSPVSHEELALPRQSWIRSQSPLQHLETCGTNSQVDEMAWCDGYFFCWQLIAVREKDVFFAYGKDSMKWRFCRC